jgi:parallel beta-helix repeat protein
MVLLLLPLGRVAKVNASRFNPGDQILFRRGDTWREQLNVPSSGTEGNPITFGAYGSGDKPIITGANLLAMFQRDSQQNIWFATTTAVVPKVVIFDGISGRKISSKVNLKSAMDWFWENGTLFIYSANDPASYLAISAGVRDWTIAVTTKNYITFNNLILEGANQNGIIFTGSGTHHITIDSCEVRNSGGSGVVLYETGLGGEHLIKNSIIHHNSGSGINGYKHIGSSAGNETYIQDNVIYNNNEAGIEWRGNYVIIEGNTVYDNGNVTTPHMGIHIFTDSPLEGTGSHNTIRYNRVYNQRGNGQDGAGIAIDQWCDHNEIYYNVTYGNDGPGIYLFDSAHCRILNNVAFGNCINSSGQLTEKGEIRLTSSAVPNHLTNFTEVKNNIGYATGTGVYAIYVDEETALNNLLITNNVWYRPDGANWFFWSKSGGNDLTAWNNVSKVGNDLKVAPRFANLTTFDFHILSGSPCIDTGSNAGLSRDLENNQVPGGSAPDIGAYEYSSVRTPRNLRIISMR